MLSSRLFRLTLFPALPLFLPTFSVPQTTPIALSSSAVGFTALFGVAIQNGVITVSYFDHQRRNGESIYDAVLNGAAVRLRPVLMTALRASIGLVPAAISTGIGSDTQKPLAVAIIGGLIADVLVGNLFVLPVLYRLTMGRNTADSMIEDGKL